MPVQTALPAELLEPCHPTAPGGPTVGEILELLEDYVMTLEACNRNLDAIRGLQP